MLRRLLFYHSTKICALGEDNNDEDTDPNPPKSEKSKKRHKKKKDFAKNLPRREVIIAAEEKTDADCFMRYDITELLNYIPPVYEIIVQKREVIVR